MNYFYTSVLSLLFFMGSTTKLEAQALKSFTETRSVYMSELKEFMTASKRPILEKAYKEYEKYFNSGVFTDVEFQQIVKTSNAMLGQKMTASPYFEQYLNCLGIVKKSEEGEARFSNWHSVLDGMLEDIQNRKIKPYKDFLAFSGNFFTQKALKHSKSGMSWYADAPVYDLRYQAGIPLVEYESLDILGVRKNDTITIKQTKGLYFPLEGMWRGEGGTVSWEKLDLNEVYAELGEYEIEVKMSIYEVPSAKLYYPDLFPGGPIEGKFTDKVTVDNKTTTGSYPRFESKKSVLQINDIGAGFQYKGGFRLEGTTVYGYGNKERPASLKLGDKLQANAQLFVIRKGEQVGGNKVETAIYFDQDSIYHPSVNFKFNISKQQLTLDRGKKSGQQTAFFDSYHKMNIDANILDWFMAENKIVVGKKSISFTKSIKKKATFESLDFFSLNEYEKLQNISTTNPISIMRIAVESTGGEREFSAEDMATRINPRYSVENAKSLYYDLVAKSFINYNEDEQLIYVKDKVLHWADARQEKVDFDYLKILSETDTVNAVMYLNNKELIANSVENIEFSSVQKVAAKPAGNQAILKKNRDIDFAGKLYSGYSLFEGKDFHFNYDFFNITADSIRYFDLFIPTGEEDDKGNKEAYSIASRIEHTAGTLLIDAPSNKSGKEDIPTFPSFSSDGSSYVYYDKTETKGGRYKRDSFYFELEEFVFNSLDNYLVEDVHFEGKMVSADIFPPFEETLLVQEEDQSLGFQHTTPSAGYTTYLERGLYKGGVNLSNQGFLGKGALKYLNASIESEDFVFMPKQMLASAQTLDMTEERSPIEIPQVHGDDVLIDWKPYSDSMYVSTKGDPFQLYKANDHTVDGTMVLTPDGVKGQGLFDWSQGQLRTKLMSFGAFSVKSDTAQIKIKAFENKGFAFDTKNVNANIDFDKQRGHFIGNEKDVITKMPYNQYQTTMNEFIWDMKGDKVTFIVEDDAFGTFTSIHPNQDSLFFDGKTAEYKLSTSELNIGGVPYIQTSDAFVYPEEGKVQVFPGGVMTQLSNAKIVCNTENKNHTINKATVNILGQKEYRATGYYEYNLPSKEQEILFEDIVGTRVGKGKKGEKKSVTRATGEITEIDNFIIDQKTGFKGTISLNAESKKLKFDGFAQLKADKLPSKSWFSINCDGEKENLLITYDEPKNFQGDPLRNGLFLSRESAIMYPRVMMPLYTRKDRPIIDVRGQFKYNAADDSFIFGDSLRMNHFVKKGNQMIFSNADASVKTEGTYILGSGLKNSISITSVGQAETKFNQFQDSTNLTTIPTVSADFMAGLMMKLPEKLQKIMLADLRPSEFDRDFIDYQNDDFYSKALDQWLTNEQAFSAKQSLQNGFFELPKKTYDYTFLFGRVPMKWDFDYQSFVSTEEKLHLAYFNGEPVNKLLESYIEVKMPTNEDDRLYLFIRAPSEYYYFLGYKQGVLNVVSNNQKFMGELTGMKAKDLLIKTKNAGEYEIAVVEPSTAQTFVSRVKAAAKN